MIPGANYAQGTRPIVKKDTVRSSYIYFSFNQDEIDPDYLDNSETVSYTHLTLPTNSRV